MPKRNVRNDETCRACGTDLRGTSYHGYCGKCSDCGTIAQAQPIDTSAAIKPDLRNVPLGTRVYWSIDALPQHGMPAPRADTKRFNKRDCARITRHCRAVTESTFGAYSKPHDAPIVSHIPRGLRAKLK